MAATNYSPISLYYSTTSGATPSAVNLVGGELALNSADGKLFYKDSGGTVQVLATKGTGSIGGSNTQVQYNSSGSLAGSANLTFDGTTLTAGGLSTAGSVTLSGGTANGVAYLNGSKVLTSGSALTFDGSNTRLGVGVASPAYTIDSGGVINTASAVYWGGGVGKLQYGGSDAYIDSTGSTIFRISGSTEQMRLTSTGLGIGTSSPSVKLDVVGTAKFSGGGGYVSYGDNGYIRTDIANKLAFQVGTSGATWRNSGNSGDLMLLDNSGNLGLGVTPSAWGSSWKSLQLPNGAALSNISGLNALYLSENAVFANDQSSKYIASDFATLYQQYNGQHRWFNAPSGTAGNTISFTQAMTLDASGNLGIGTTSPVNILDISTASPRVRVVATTGINNNLLQLVNTGGTVYIGLDNSTGGSLTAPYALNLYHTGAYPIVFSNNNTERARIDSSGNLLVGTTSVSNQCRFTVANTNSTRTWAFGTSSTSTPFYVIDNTSGSGVQLTAGGTSWSAFSDENLKTDLAPIENAIQKVATLRAVTGRFKTDEEGVSRAFLIAQDVQAVLPEAVASTTLPGTDDETEYLSLAYTDTIPLLVAAIKELKAEFDAYKATHP